MNRHASHAPRGTEHDESSSGSCRLDKWLWAARFYKTRSLATEAVDAGHIRINGVRPKPARTVKIGDRIDIVRGADTIEITVTALSDRRGNATFASTLYRETPDSIAEREKRHASATVSAHSPHPPVKPNKRERRQLQRFLMRD